MKRIAKRIALTLLALFAVAAVVFGAFYATRIQTIG